MVTRNWSDTQYEEDETTVKGWVIFWIIFALVIWSAALLGAGIRNNTSDSSDCVTTGDVGAGTATIICKEHRP